MYIYIHTYPESPVKFLFKDIKQISPNSFQRVKIKMKKSHIFIFRELYFITILFLILDFHMSTRFVS